MSATTPWIRSLRDRRQGSHAPDQLRLGPWNGRDPRGSLQGERTSNTGELPRHHHLHLGGRGATIISLYKRRAANPTAGTTEVFPSSPSLEKILPCTILERLITSVSERNMPEAQCGFRPNRSTTDMIFAVRQVQEKCKEQIKELHKVFIDLTKAFETENREALCVILQRLGCPRKFVNLIRQFHDDMTGAVLSGARLQNLSAFPVE
ncbi:hypothetical protein RRG08_025790 [Elysia crispata]|uniref:Reverse transcriptase domain-containing protein n=1 Tax=Elysia crispata TaxID=231223 RepID=A0AAE1CRT8_9GAST|nr:hypothetical protein RRG08_025790 [Elysia crispata]